MIKYVEDSDNTIFQVFNEFAEFLDCIYYFHKSRDKHVKNMALNSMRTHARIICDFFQNSKGAYDDDLIYTDIIRTTEDLSISMSKDLRIFINKSTVHISKQRGKILAQNYDYSELIKKLAKSINLFVSKCEYLLKEEYQNDYQDEDVKILKQFISKRLFQIEIFI